MVLFVLGNSAGSILERSTKSGWIAESRELIIYLWFGSLDSFHDMTRERKTVSINKM